MLWKRLRNAFATPATHKEADQLTAQRLDKIPTARNYYLHARNLFDARQEKEAETILRAALKRFPGRRFLPGQPGRHHFANQRQG